MTQLVSIIIPCFNEVEGLPSLEQHLAPVLAQLQMTHLETELIIVDDGSRDGTWQAIVAWAARDHRVRGIRLSRNFGHQAALTCGYDLARGDAVVCLDADLQDPPELIPDMVARWRDGFDIVLAVRRRRKGESAFKLWTAALFYRLLRVLGAGYVRADSGDFRLLSRQSLTALNAMREQHRFIRGMVGWIGFNTTEIFYDRDARHIGRTHYPLRKMLRLALDAMVSFSSAPLRLAYVLSGVLMLMTLGYLMYVLMVHFVWGISLVPGWTSLLLAIIGFGAMNLFCLGLMGEYVGRIYEQVKHRPVYFVAASAEQPPAAAAPTAPSGNEPSGAPTSGEPR
ncbi:MAG: glycosyltransferase family 2 protein [Phycisphaerales bacterium]|nr:glycosyltransferase family 2 protein [Phycisphaerales bacterium]